MDLKERLLERVLGPGPIAHQPVQKPQELFLVPLDQLPKRGILPAPVIVEELFVRVLLHAGNPNAIHSQAGLLAHPATSDTLRSIKTPV